jgi:hypothetical protein
VLERAKTVRALDRSATAIETTESYDYQSVQEERASPKRIKPFHKSGRYKVFPELVAYIGSSYQQ